MAQRRAMANELLSRRVEVTFVARPPARQIAAAVGVSDVAVDDLHVADPDGRCDLSRWGPGDERHLDSSAQELICHGRSEERRVGKECWFGLCGLRERVFML